MLIGLGWIMPMLLAGGWLAVSQAAAVDRRPPEPGPPLQAILEMESAARLLAILLDSGRYVISENQALFDDPDKRDKRFTPEAFEQQLTEIFHTRSGIDLRELEPARLPRLTKELFRLLVAVSKRVVAEAQPEPNRTGVGFKGFIPAVFGTRVAGRFTQTTGVKLKQTALTPRNPANAPDPFEKTALEEFADPSYPKERVISEITAGSKVLRLMFPLYATRGCLGCHGEPKGLPDKSGYPREGVRLGQNAGAISIVIPIRQ